MLLISGCLSESSETENETVHPDAVPSNKKQENSDTSSSPEASNLLKYQEYQDAIAAVHEAYLYALRPMEDFFILDADYGDSPVDNKEWMDMMDKSLENFRKGNDLLYSIKTVPVEVEDIHAHFLSMAESLEIYMDLYPRVMDQAKTEEYRQSRESINESLSYIKAKDALNDVMFNYNEADNLMREFGEENGLENFYIFNDEEKGHMNSQFNGE
ncbi:hypothetical protein JF544_14050 [Halobacillus kuroshimensis]|uniref:Lipoprotein n=1 Tax=Halobacillus kuroshimensis TaxID=302481 RepID=A0ABS3DYJ3_9BACI|nr:hypothetical protein [Halobacillus kuroshimensis]MBN8236386.1 hypothetical protein [Halobacillus kuroshimensis]